MKKILVILFILLMCSFVYAEENEALVVLPNGEAASDSFSSNAINTDRWEIHVSNKWKSTGSGLIAKSSNDHRFLVQTYDYNADGLKSDYYRFELEMTEKRSNGNKYETGGITLLTDPDDIWSGYYKSTMLLNNGKVYSYISNDYDEFNYSQSSSNHTLKYVMILKRINDTNGFNIEQLVYKDGTLIHTNAGSATLDEIYPTVWAYAGFKAKFKSLKVYSVPTPSSTISITGLKQVGDEASVSWQMDNDDMTHVKIVYGSDADLKFDGSDTVLYSGPQDFGFYTFDIPTTEPFYVGVKGYSSGDETEGVVELFTPLLAVDELSYAHGVGDAYTFTWHAVEGATSYDVFNGSDVVNRDNDNRTVTFSGVTDPTSVYIVAKKTALGGGFSESEATYATLGTLGAVENLEYTLDSSDIQLTWDVMNGASDYIVYRDYGTGSFVMLTDDLKVPVYNTQQNSQNVVSQYKVKAVVDDVVSLASNVVEIVNKVKDLNAVIGSTIELTWTPIGDAESYKIYVSRSTLMSDSDVYTSNDPNYELAYIADDGDPIYIQVEAIKGSYTSERSDVLTLDMSYNLSVENLQVSYTKNSGIVNLTWDRLPGAIEYKVYYGVSAGSVNTEVNTTNNHFDYVIENSDTDVLYYKVQAVGALDDYLTSEVVSSATYSIDEIIGITAITDSGVINLNWASLNRTVQYQVLISDHSDMSDATVVTSVESDYDYTVTKDDLVTKYFRVRGYNGAVYSQSSAIVSSEANDGVEINVSKINVEDPEIDLSRKYYGDAMYFNVDFKINEHDLYSPKITFELSHIKLPGETNDFLSFVYPEIGDISVSGFEGDLEYLTQIKTTDAGYEVVISFTNADIHTIMTVGETISVPIRTDARFAETIEVNKEKQSILYVGPSDFLTWMALPFVIEEQLSLLTSSDRLNLSTDALAVVLNNFGFSAQLAYKTVLNAGVTVREDIKFAFKNRVKVPTQTD